MAASNTVIANLALAHIGVSQSISDLESERSAEANICRVFYDIALKTTLRDFDWPFAKKIADLVLLEEEPNDEWLYSYVYPSDCLRFRRILSGTRNDTQQTRVRFQEAHGDDTTVLFTDMEDAQGEYTVYADDPTRYPPDFDMALSLRLAGYIAPHLTGGDPFKMGAKAIALYEVHMSRASANALNEIQPEEPVESEFIRARD